MKTLADVKRRAVHGALLKLEDAAMRSHKYLGETRKIEKVQRNAVCFEGGSWLEWPKASDVQVRGDEFIIYQDGVMVLHYTFVEDV